uniref:Uncharacterized protein n=1 Tax=Rhizophora mucronata TaxID=61149 RepID=A0A2P2Q883_RHIMU
MFSMYIFCQWLAVLSMIWYFYDNQGMNEKNGRLHLLF